ncbi:MAG: CHAT domain-containing protein, partial [bacterium]|nr:CHAT domain-containing protein [bacterium]
IRYAADVALKWKQIYAEEYAFQHRLLRFSDDPAIKKLRTDISRLRSAFSLSIRQNDTGREPGSIMQDLNQAEDALRDKARSLKPDLLVSGENTERLIGRLPERSALIEFKRFTLKDFKTGKALSRNWAASLLLSDIDAEQQVFFEDLGSDEDLQKILNESKDSMQSLYSMFFSPFEQRLSHVDTLYIAPDGFLNILPLAALKTQDGRYLAQTFTIKQLQTGRDLIDTSPETAANLLIAMGGVNYGQLPGQQTEAAVGDDLPKSLDSLNPNLRAARELEKGLPYLPYSRDEVEAIERLFKSNSKDGQSRIYTELDAAESLLKNLDRAPRILHLSTHGFYLEKAEDSPLAEAEPMVLSGLALAGANQGLNGILDSNGDDGLLYSLEVLGLNLQGTELVSLSACETGKGVIDYSEGVYGLIRAFRTAGAKHV